MGTYQNTEIKENIYWKIKFVEKKISFVKVNHKPQCKYARALPNSIKDGAPRLPVTFFLIERYVHLFYSYLEKNNLPELKNQMEFILHIQNIYRNLHKIEITDEIENTYRRYFKNGDQLNFGWIRRMLLEVQMRNKPATMHVFDKALNKCIQTVNPELQSFIDSLVISVI